MVTTIRLPDELHKALKAEAEKRGLTFNLWKKPGTIFSMKVVQTAIHRI